MLKHPAVCLSLLCTRDSWYGGLTEDMRVHYKTHEGETIQHVDIIGVYQYICKYMKFPWPITSFKWQTRAKTWKSAYVCMA